MDGPQFWTLAVLAATFVGMGKGGLPVVAMLSVPVLSLTVSPVAAAGLLLPVYVVSDVFGIWAYRHEFNGRVLRIALWWLPVGVAAGWATAEIVPERVITAIIGLIGLIFALNLLLRRGAEPEPAPVSWKKGWFWCVLSGYTSFISHAGAPPWQVWLLPLRLTKLAFAGTTTLAFAYINAVKLIPYAALGQLGVENLKVSAVLMVPASLSVFLGLWLVRLLPEKWFFSFVTWALLAVSLKLIWDGVVG